MPYAKARVRGFTLVEVVVVLGVIAVLVSLLLPALGRARGQARAVACQSNLRQIGLGFQMYADQNGGWLPACGEDADPASPLLLDDRAGWESGQLWMNGVCRQVSGETYDEIQAKAAAGRGRVPNEGDHHVLVCPSASRAAGVKVGVDADEVTPDGYFLMHGYLGRDGNLTDDPRKTFVCYAMNYKLFGANVFGGKMSSLRPGSEVVLVFEKRTNAGEATAADDAYYQSMGGKAGAVTASFLGRFKGDWKRLSTRHNKGGYLVFADGHVGFSTLRDALTPLDPSADDWNKPGVMVWDVAGPATR